MALRPEFEAVSKDSEHYLGYFDAFQLNGRQLKVSLLQKKPSNRASFRCCEEGPCCLAVLTNQNASVVLNVDTLPGVQWRARFWALVVQPIYWGGMLAAGLAFYAMLNWVMVKVFNVCFLPGHGSSHDPDITWAFCTGAGEQRLLMWTLPAAAICWGLYALNRMLPCPASKLLKAQYMHYLRLCVHPHALSSAGLAESGDQDVGLATMGAASHADTVDTEAPLLQGRSHAQETGPAV
ncbi:hypothetical protein WJX72_005146 [[Myrmecia] bisecta]|uniref:Uncharacterized protein n=1 Tax=[Myrmecia] bisecta TaxID=41462 RepID=A0AAW1QAN8_9CHLO